MPTDDEKAMPDVEEAAAFQRDLYLYWSAARELGELALTTRGFLTRSALRRLRSQWPSQMRIAPKRTILGITISGGCWSGWDSCAFQLSHRKHRRMAGW